VNSSAASNPCAAACSRSNSSKSGRSELIVPESMRSVQDVKVLLVQAATCFTSRQVIVTRSGLNRFPRPTRSTLMPSMSVRKNKFLART